MSQAANFISHHLSFVDVTQEFFLVYLTNLLGFIFLGKLCYTFKVESCKAFVMVLKSINIWYSKNIKTFQEKNVIQIPTLIFTKHPGPIQLISCDVRVMSPRYIFFERAGDK